MKRIGSMVRFAGKAAAALTLIIALLSLGFSALAAPVAVADRNEEAWYTVKRLSGGTGGYSLAVGQAPFPVLVEAWRSDPNPSDGEVTPAERTSIVSYSWDWGDGSAATEGYVAAHVYEVVGDYTITLTVTFAGGATDTDTLGVEVIEPATYRYVDSEAGSDANGGTSWGDAWQTATKVAQVAGTAGALPAGTRVVFKDDQAFDLFPGVWTAVRAVGVTFARSGDGSNRPVIRRVVDPANPAKANDPLVRVTSIDLNHAAWWGLEFDGLSADKAGFGSVFVFQGRGCQVLVHECRLVNGRDLVGFTSPASPNVLTNCYVSACTGGNAGAYQEGSGYYKLGSTLLYAKTPGRWAVINSAFDYSNNHIFYADYGRGCVVKGNQFRYPACGRHCFRLSGGSDITVPTQNVWVGYNVFTGWIDPIQQANSAHNAPGFERYNNAPFVIAPNTNTPQSIEWVEATGNTVSDGEILLNLAAASHVRVHGNAFSTTAPYQSSPRLQFGDSKERRPLYDVDVYGNTWTTTETRASGKGILVELLAYAGPEWGGLTRHTGLVVRDNDWTITGSVPWAFHLPDDAAQRAQLVHANTWTGIDRDSDNAVLVGATWNTPGLGTQSTLAEWYASTGNEPASGTAPELPPATPPAASSKRVGVRR
jgi:PKD repeat protein